MIGIYLNYYLGHVTFATTYEFRLVTLGLNLLVNHMVIFLVELFSYHNAVNIK
jgi:hypothetical protein